MKFTKELHDGDGITSYDDTMADETAFRFGLQIPRVRRLPAIRTCAVVSWRRITGPISKRRFLFNLATARPITLSVPPNERYNEGGAFTLVDGITAQEKRVSTEWLGWKEGVTITVDLGSVQDIRYVGIGALNETHSWIHLPKRVDFSVSADGSTFTPFGSAESESRCWAQRVRSGPSRARRVTSGSLVKHRGHIPEGFPGAGNPAWMFLDEIEVY